jgi:hypothetical protein
MIPDLAAKPPTTNDRELAIGQLLADCKLQESRAVEQLGQHDLTCTSCKTSAVCGSHSRLAWRRLRCAERTWKAEHGEVL